MALDFAGLIEHAQVKGLGVQVDSAALVKIEAIGYKEGSTLFVHGEEYEL
jgi:hypothetical protein